MSLVISLHDLSLTRLAFIFSHLTSLDPSLISPPSLTTIKLTKQTTKQNTAILCASKSCKPEEIPKVQDGAKEVCACLGIKVGETAV